jgi:serine/threonine protein kinase
MEASNFSHTDRLDRLAEEFVERYRRGERPDWREYLARHPDLADDIRDLLPALIRIEQTPHGPASPMARVGSFQLPRGVGRGSRDGPVHEARQRSLDDNTPAHYDFLAPAERPDEIGRLGGYRILKVVAAGGMGVVFQAEDPKLKRMLAIKAMLPSLAASESARRRFLREGQTAASLEHDHIVAIHEVGEDRGVPFIAIPFLKGEPLDHRLKRDGSLCVAEVVKIGRETARGLAAAHAVVLIHRDIKPANLWLEMLPGEPDAGASDVPPYRVKILDFGLARAVADDAQLTQQGAIIGTPAYMAPEQAAGKALDARCDLFSLGCVLYRLATGQAPFKGSDAISTLLSVANDEPPPGRVIELRQDRQQLTRPPMAGGRIEAECVGPSRHAWQRMGVVPGRARSELLRDQSAERPARARRRQRARLPWRLVEPPSRVLPLGFPGPQRTRLSQPRPRLSCPARSACRWQKSLISGALFLAAHGARSFLT